MKGLMLVIGAAIGAIILAVYMNGPGALPSGVPPQVGQGAQQAGNAAAQAGNEIYTQPWFWTAAVAGGLASLGVITWRRIGNWGRGVVIVLATIMITVIVAKVH